MAKPMKKYSNISKSSINYIKKKLNITKIDQIDGAILKKLKESLKKLKDDRNKNMITFKIWDVVMCVILASFSDCNDWEDIHMFVKDNYKWLRSFLQMTGGVPTAESYERIMSIVDKDELNTILLEFFHEISFNLSLDTEILNFDGRVNNGSKRKETLENSEIKPLNCLNCYSNKYGYCIETVQIDDKTNEIPTIEELVRGMDLSGTIATWDALNTQTKNVNAVVQVGGNYVIPVKGNQGNFYSDLMLYFDDDTCEKIIAGNPQSVYKKINEKSHSSIITYEYFQTIDIGWYSKKNDWSKLRSFGMVKKTIIKSSETKGKKEEANVEKRYYISSLPLSINDFSKAIREHWAIENKLHWHLDVTFRQDANRTTNKKALLNLEIVHKFILALLNRVKSMYKLSLKSIRKHLSNNYEEFFPELLCYLMIS